MGQSVSIEQPQFTPEDAMKIGQLAEIDSIPEDNRESTSTKSLHKTLPGEEHSEISEAGRINKALDFSREVHLNSNPLLLIDVQSLHSAELSASPINSQMQSIQGSVSSSMIKQTSVRSRIKRIIVRTQHTALISKDIYKLAEVNKNKFVAPISNPRRNPSNPPQSEHAKKESIKEVKAPVQAIVQPQIQPKLESVEDRSSIKDFLANRLVLDEEQDFNIQRKGVSEIIKPTPTPLQPKVEDQKENFNFNIQRKDMSEIIKPVSSPLVNKAFNRDKSPPEKLSNRISSDMDQPKKNRTLDILRREKKEKDNKTHDSLLSLKKDVEKIKDDLERSKSAEKERRKILGHDFVPGKPLLSSPAPYSISHIEDRVNKPVNQPYQMYSSQVDPRSQQPRSLSPNILSSSPYKPNIYPEPAIMFQKIVSAQNYQAYSPPPNLARYNQNVALSERGPMTKFSSNEDMGRKDQARGYSPHQEIYQPIEAYNRSQIIYPSHGPMRASHQNQTPPRNIPPPYEQGQYNYGFGSPQRVEVRRSVSPNQVQQYANYNNTTSPHGRNNGVYRENDMNYNNNPNYGYRNNQDVYTAPTRDIYDPRHNYKGNVGPYDNYEAIDDADAVNLNLDLQDLIQEYRTSHSEHHNAQQNIVKEPIIQPVTKGKNTSTAVSKPANSQVNRYQQPEHHQQQKNPPKNVKQPVSPLTKPTNVTRRGNEVIVQYFPSETKPQAVKKNLAAEQKPQKFYLGKDKKGQGQGHGRILEGLEAKKEKNYGAQAAARNQMLGRNDQEILAPLKNVLESVQGYEVPVGYPSRDDVARRSKWEMRNEKGYSSDPRNQVVDYNPKKR